MQRLSIHSDTCLISYHTVSKHFSFCGNIKKEGVFCD